MYLKDEKMKKLLILILLTYFTYPTLAQKRTYQLGLMVDYRTPIGDSLLVQLEKEVSKVVGEDATIQMSEQYIHVNECSIAKATSDYQDLLNAPVDAILVLGSIGEKALEGITDFNKPTVIFGNYNLERPTHDETKTNNLIRILDRSYLENDLTALHELTDFKSVGIAVEQAYANELGFAASLNKITTDLGVEYQLIAYDNFSEIQSNLDGIDAFYLVGGQLTEDKEISALADHLLQKRIPSMSTGGISHLNQGFMSTTVPRGNFEQMIRNISVSIDAFVQMEPLPDGPVILEYEPKLTININIAEVVGVFVPYSSMDDTDLVWSADHLNPQLSYDFESFLSATLGKNLGFGAAKKEVQMKNQDVQSAKNNYLPTVTAGASSAYTSPDFAEISFGQTAEYQTVGSINFEQTIFSAQANTNIEIEKNLLKIEEQRLSTKELDLVLEASNAFFNALLAKSETNIQAGNLQLTKTNYQIARQNYQSGQTDKSDLLRLESQLAVDKQRMVTSINRLQQALIRLNQLTNSPLENQINIVDLKVDNGFFQGFTYDEFERILDDDVSRERFVRFLAQESRNNSPEIKSLAYLDEVTSRQMKLFGAQRLIPSLGLQAEYANFVDRRGAGSVVEGFNIPGDYYTVGVGVSLPILSGNRNKVSHQRARIQKEQINLNTRDAEQALETSVRSITFEVINQMATIKLTRETEQTAKEALEIIQDAYSNGAVGVVQLFDIQNTYLQAQISRTQADYGYLINIASLERIIAHYSVLRSDEANEQLKQRFLTFK